MKKDSILILGIVVIFAIVVMVSGCTGSTTEKLVGTYSLSEASSSALGGSELIKDLPANTESVRVEYTLTGDAYGSNGNFGVNPDKIDPGSGEDPVSFVNMYVEAGAGETIKGSKEFGSGQTFYYSGNFASGTFKVYASVYE